MDINGIWKGEYITEWFEFKTGREVPVPFVMKLKGIGQFPLLTNEKALFEGICQDDPEISKITLHANISGAVTIDSIFMIKQYPKLLIRNATDNLEMHEGLHPEIVYRGEFQKDKFSGTWTMNRTFRKINNNLCELMPLKGSWWMSKL